MGKSDVPERNDTTYESYNVTFDFLIFSLWYICQGKWRLINYYPETENVKNAVQFYVERILCYLVIVIKLAIYYFIYWLTPCLLQR